MQFKGATEGMKRDKSVLMLVRIDGSVTHSEAVCWAAQSAMHWAHRWSLCPSARSGRHTAIRTSGI